MMSDGGLNCVEIRRRHEPLHAKAATALVDMCLAGTGRSSANSQIVRLLCLPGELELQASGPGLLSLRLVVM